jgi:D-alanyl-D-alanine carboxypeptidase
VVLGAPSGAARAVKAAEMLESGFAQNPLSWLTPALGSVDALVPIDASPPNLKDEMCGPHRKRHATEEEDADTGNVKNGSGNTGDSNAQFSVLLSALRAPTPKNANLLSDAGPVTPIVVYTGPTRTPAELANLASLPEEAANPGKKKAKHKPAAAKPASGKSADAKPADGKPAIARPADGKAVAAKPPDGKVVAAKPADGKATDGKATAATVHWTPMSSSALAVSPPPDLKADAPVSAPAPKKQPKAQPPVKPNPTPSQ